MLSMVGVQVSSAQASLLIEAEQLESIQRIMCCKVKQATSLQIAEIFHRSFEANTDVCYRCQQICQEGKEGLAYLMSKLIPETGHRHICRLLIC